MKKIAILALAALIGFSFVSLAEDEHEDEHEHEGRKGAHHTSSGSNTRALPPASTKANVTYAADIKPILDASCADCHEGNKAKAHLQLDSLAGVLKGSEEGKVVVAGDSARSLLVKSVAHLTKDREGWMPPLQNKKGIKPLLPDEIGLIRAWIDQGAK